MYFIFVSDDLEPVQLLEQVLHQMDAKKTVINVPDGFELIQLLQNVKKGESYPDLIVLTPAFLRLGGMDLLELLKTDDIYCLIPVFMLLPENNGAQETICNRLGTTYMISPKNQVEWTTAATRMCAACG